MNRQEIIDKILQTSQISLCYHSRTEKQLKVTVNHNRVVPCIHALLPGNTEGTYNEFFLQIKIYFKKDANSQGILLNFEVGVVSAAQ